MARLSIYVDECQRPVQLRFNCFIDIEQMNRTYHDWGRPGWLAWHQFSPYETGDKGLDGWGIHQKVIVNGLLNWLIKKEKNDYDAYET